MDDQTAQFLPFHAVNDFMRDDYRLEVIRVTLKALPDLQPEYRDPIERLTRSHIQVPGFRNSAKAPVSKRLKPTADEFENNPQVAAAILSAWTEAHPELKRQVYDMLVSGSWEMLPIDVNRAVLPGFVPNWPERVNFETLHSTFVERYPSSEAKPDDISLMVVWLSVRLPYHDHDHEHDHDHDHDHEHEHEHDLNPE